MKRRSRNGGGGQNNERARETNKPRSPLMARGAPVPHGVYGAPPAHNAPHASAALLNRISMHDRRRPRPDHPTVDPAPGPFVLGIFHSAQSRLRFARQCSRVPRWPRSGSVSPLSFHQRSPCSSDRAPVFTSSLAIGSCPGAHSAASSAWPSSPQYQTWRTTCSF